MRGNGASRTAWVAILISFVSLGYNVWADRIKFREVLTLSVTPVLEDYPTQLIDARGTPSGTVGTYWNVVVANNSDRDISLVEYRLREIRGEGDNLFYSSLDQGLFTTTFSRLDLPLNIPAGHSLRLFFRVGLLMDPQAFRISKGVWKTGTVESIRRLLEYLNSKGYGIYGQFNELGLKSLKRLAANQIFLVAFRTGRRTEVQATFYSSFLPFSRFQYR